MDCVGYTQASLERFEIFKKGLFTGLKYGLALGISTFFSFLRCRIYCIVCIGETPSFTILYYKFFIYTHINGSSLIAVIVCIISNIVNVYVEEGLFRGLFCKIGLQCYSQYSYTVKKQEIKNKGQTASTTLFQTKDQKTSIVEIYITGYGIMNNFIHSIQKS